MELKKINYASAVFFAAAAFVMYFITGILQLIVINRAPEYAEAIGGAVPAWQVLILIPLIGGIVTYIAMLLLIYIYNKTAKKYPISWEVKK